VILRRTIKAVESTAQVEHSRTISEHNLLKPIASGGTAH